MIGVMHAANSYSHSWNEEQDRQNILCEVARKEDIGDAGEDINNPGEENEVPELKSSSGSIYFERLVERGHIDINKVLHG